MKLIEGRLLKGGQVIYDHNNIQAGKNIIPFNGGVSYNTAAGAMLEQVIAAKDFSLTAYNFKFNEEVLLTFRQEKATIKLMYMLEGSISVSYEHGACVQPSGSYSLRYVPGKTDFEVRFSPGEYAYVAFSMDYDLVLELSEQLPQISRFLERIDFNRVSIHEIKSRLIDRRSRVVLREIAQYVGPTGIAQLLFLRSKLYALLHLHVNQLHLKTVMPGEVLTQQEIDDVTDYIHNNLMEHVTLDMISASLGLSKKKLMNSFPFHYGVKFQTYMLQARMHQAIKLLDEGQPVKAIYHHLGYDNHSAFYKAFKSFYGRTPADIRKKIR